MTAAEQRLLRALGVFAGGASLEAIAWLGFDLRTVQALANKSLVRLESMGDDRRAAMLETVRDFVLHRLLEADEEQATQRGRLAWCIARAEQAAPLLQSAAQTRWLEQLEPDRYNFYAALRFALDAGAVAEAVRLCVALRHFWVARNHVAEMHAGSAPFLRQQQTSISTRTFGSSSSTVQEQSPSIKRTMRQRIHTLLRLWPAPRQTATATASPTRWTDLALRPPIAAI